MRAETTVAYTGTQRTRDGPGAGAPVAAAAGGVGGPPAPIGAPRNPCAPAAAAGGGVGGPPMAPGAAGGRAETTSGTPGRPPVGDLFGMPSSSSSGASHSVTYAAGNQPFDFSSRDSPNHHYTQRSPPAITFEERFNVVGEASHIRFRG